MRTGLKRIGLHCHRESGAYVVTVLDPDGSETRTTFDEEESMMNAEGFAAYHVSYGQPIETC